MALNRADTFQRSGKYPPPKGCSKYPGLKCSGTIGAVGKNVTRWKVGDQVCCLLDEGGYAEKVAVPAGQVLPIPVGLSLKDAAGFPEVACTVWSTVFMTNHLSAGEIFLIHGGSSGIGSEEKLAACKELGAEDFVAQVKERTADVVDGPSNLYRGIGAMGLSAMSVFWWKPQPVSYESTNPLKWP